MALNNRAVEWQLKNLKPLKTTKLRTEMTQWAHKSQTIYSIKSLFVLVGIFFFVASFILCCQCLSCLIIKCMLLTFIFNYFPSRLCDVATSPSSSSLSCPAQSSISHSFSVYQVDIFMLQTHTHTHIRAHKSPTRGEGNIKKILFLAKHEESAERAKSHDRRRFFYRKYGRKTWACVGGEHRRHVFRCKRKHFLTKTSHSSIFPPPASELSFVKTRRLFSGRLFPSRFPTTLRFRCIRSRRGALADASTK